MLLNVKLESKIVTSNSRIGTATATEAIVALTVVRHLGYQEEVVTVDIYLKA